MARQPRPDPEVVVDDINPNALASASQALTVHALHSQAVSHALGDDAPYDQARVLGMAHYFMGSAAEAALLVGKCLIQLKANEPHGEFVQIVEEKLGMSRRTAQIMMQAATRFLAPALQAKAQGPALLGLGKAKLFELIAEPDEAIEALLDGGTIAGKSLDDMHSMTSVELRAALAEARKTMAAKDKVIAAKDAKLNKLAEADEVRRNGTPNEREEAQVGELRDAGLAAEQALRAVVAAVDEVLQAPATEAAGLQARQTIDYVCQRLADLCGERHVSVDVLGERVEPGWVRDLAALADAAPKSKRRA